MTQFPFLRAEWPLTFEAARQAEEAVWSDPRTACFQARRALELLVKWVYRHDSTLRSPYQTHLNALLFEGTFKDLVGERLLAKAKIIKDLGNQAVHTGRPVRPEDAVVAVRELFHVGFWLARTYARRARPSDDLRFDPTLLPRPSGQAPQALPQLQQNMFSGTYAFHSTGGTLQASTAIGVPTIRAIWRTNSPIAKHSGTQTSLGCNCGLLSGPAQIAER